MIYIYVVLVFYTPDTALYFILIDLYCLAIIVLTIAIHSSSSLSLMFQMNRRHNLAFQSHKLGLICMHVMTLLGLLCLFVV